MLYFKITIFFFKLFLTGRKFGVVELGNREGSGDRLLRDFAKGWM